jgi:hypothetical protein
MVRSLAAAVSLLLLTGCMPSLSSSTSSSTLLKGHVMALNTDAAGNAVSVKDRSGSANNATVTTYFLSDEAQTVDIAVAGQLQNGTTVPSRAGLKVDPKITNKFIAAAAGTDSFLGLANVKGTHFAVGAYGVRDGSTTFFGLGATGNRTTDMPATGTARYNGAIAATVAGSTSGFQTVAGTVTMDANFGPGQATISGRAANLVSTAGGATGYDVLMEPTAFIGNEYANGKLKLVQRGGTAAVGSMTSSDYQGGFYGGGAAETAGTFQFGADGVPVTGGTGTESLQSIGVFGAAK